MPNPTERRIIQARNAAKSGAVLVPLLEQLLEHECIPEDDEDFRFMDMLVRVRAIPRQKGVFSPSMLGSCIRQAYFAKRGEEKHLAHSPQTNGYFLKGNFIHFQWQFALWKAHRAGLLELVKVPAENRRIAWETGDAELGPWRWGVEVRIVNGDFGGTIDGLVRIGDAYYVVDFKGINVIDFQRTLRNGAKRQYRVQIVGYGDNVNQSVLPYEVDDCLLVSENKAGPTNSLSGSPLALHETRVSVAAHMPEVKRRLRTLRWYDSRDELPPIECVSTTHMGYQECPFNRYCRDEVKAVQRERQKKQEKKNGERTYKVAKPVR